MSDDAPQESPSHIFQLDEFERRKALALEQMRRFAAEAEEAERDKAEFQRMAAKLSAKYGMTVHVNGVPIEAATSRAALPEFSTVAELANLYQSRQDSPYQKLQHNSRATYATLIALIDRDHGSQVISDINTSVLQQWYEAWKAGNKAPVARSKMVMLRSLFGFGFSNLGNEDCARLAGILSKMTLEAPKVRTEHLTYKQADAIRLKAHEKKRPSIALAQAFQSDAGLLQKDVIGEWVPVGEPGISDIIVKGLKWVRGLRWEEIDGDMVLRHSAGGKDIEVDLKWRPMVMEELARVKSANGGQLPVNGPVVISEWDNLPWDAVEFRRWWRVLANECGIPKTVRNSDSRAKTSYEATRNAAASETKGGHI